jgi:hypothetical protein
MSDFRYPTPTESPLIDIEQYIPLLLAAVDQELDRPDVWPDGEAEIARGFIEDLKSWIMGLTNS